MSSYKKPSEIKVGVVGYGGAFNMGKKHLDEMQAAGMTPTAVCELDAARLEVAQADFPGIETYGTVGEMLGKSDVDLVAIITPHNTHATLALQCLNAGRHVVCEKPLAITTAECDRMIAAAKKSGAMLSTYHNRHWDGCIRQAVKLIRDKGKIGEVVRVEAHMGGYREPRDWWRTSKSISGGIMYDWGVHLLEYSLQLIDAGITEVSGYSHTGLWAETSKWGADTNEDEGFAVVRFDSGQWLSLCMSSLDQNPKRGMLEVTGTKGTYIMNGGDYELITRNRAGETVITKGWSLETEGWRFYKNVAAHLVDGEDLVISAEWARRPIHILDLADRSARTGKAIKAKYA